MTHVVVKLACRCHSPREHHWVRDEKTGTLIVSVGGSFGIVFAKGGTSHLQMQMQSLLAMPFLKCPCQHVHPWVALGVSGHIHVVGGERVRDVGPELFARQRGWQGKEKMQLLFVRQSLC